MSNIRFVIGFLAIGICNLSAAELPCEQHYLAGLDKMSMGGHREASADFQAAIELSPTPSLDGTEYLPYIHLAVANYEAGRFISARNALIQSQVYGLAAKSTTGARLIDQYAAKIMSAPIDGEETPLTGYPMISLAALAQPETPLSEAEVQSIRALVLKRCALSSDLEQNKLPWYFHYEFGMDLMQAGDVKRALDSLILGANVHVDPSRGKRMYGMWFIDYIPYYNIALAYSKLGDWKSAQEAIITSRSFGEFSPSDPGYEEFVSLELIIANHFVSSES